MLLLPPRLLVLLLLLLLLPPPPQHLQPVLWLHNLSVFLVPFTPSRSKASSSSMTLLSVTVTCHNTLHECGRQTDRPQQWCNILIACKLFCFWYSRQPPANWTDMLRVWLGVRRLRKNTNSGLQRGGENDNSWPGNRHHGMTFRPALVQRYAPSSSRYAPRAAALSKFVINRNRRHEHQLVPST